MFSVAFRGNFLKFFGFHPVTQTSSKFNFLSAYHDVCLVVDGECVTETEYLGSGQLFCFFVTCGDVRAFICLDCKKYKNLLINIRGSVCVFVKNVSVISPILFIIHLSLSFKRVDLCRSIL